MIERSHAFLTKCKEIKYEWFSKFAEYYFLNLKTRLFYLLISIPNNPSPTLFTIRLTNQKLIFKNICNKYELSNSSW